ncbi:MULTISPECIES: TRAP transporter small permease [Roseomonadaceae]|uniref:TRAP transporter small permease protein n=1 Tax=Falsiroseomonas oleicola TaxID=2801474 RepID=A0ABS6H934_9PROT|nr:TRAP transporter small permease subunit [Roseomonas oleicola]MBU8545222.1 TRAP transporter small permease subunit [Roseomonas oleicola]
MRDDLAPDWGQPPGGAIGLAARALAFLGGVSLLVAALVTTISVVLRWFTSQPIRGDFEIVSIASGVGVFGFLAYGTLMRANILVDTFSTWLPRRVAGAVDGFWMVVWGGVTLWLAERMGLGALETWRNGMRTIGLLALPYWWAVAIGALAFAMTGVAALVWALRFLRGRF